MTTDMLLIVTLSPVSLILVGLCVLMVVWLTWQMIRIRKAKAREEERELRPRMVTAGDRKESDISDVKWKSLAGKRFRNKDGSVFDVRDYDTFVVNGDSMRYCGITDGSLIFVTKGVAVGDLETLPKPVVIEWDDHKAQEVGYKLRRAWATWIPAENPDDMLRAIFENPKFAQLRDASAFDGEKAMVEDFKSVRLPRYLRRYGTADGGSLTDVALVSTTYHVDDDKIRFSIHPLSSLRGVVRASFNPHS